MRQVTTGKRIIGESQPVYVIAEIGINHNGSLDIAQKLIQGAADAGCDAVKFQKRTPELCVPKDQWNIERETPWGVMKYIDYRYRMELTFEDFTKIDAQCKALGIDWIASCWDNESVDFVNQFDTPFYKAASASLTDYALLDKMLSTGRALMISTGMSTEDEIKTAVDHIGTNNLLIAHSTSTYPCPIDELNLRMIQTLMAAYPDTPIGYSGHETGLSTTWVAVALGASFVERHITLDRAMWGSDQAASVEVVGFRKLVSNIRVIERAMGDGVKKLYNSELGARAKLRRFIEPQL